MQNVFRSSLLTIIAILAFSMISSAQTSPSAVAGINIKNFGQMDHVLYRGGQPSETDYKALASIGIKTIVDLRNDKETFARVCRRSSGPEILQYPEWMAFRLRARQTLAKFLKIVNDPASGKVYMHCKAGIHRTGAMGAVYRIADDGWDYDKTFAEMKNYQFSAGLFHGGLQKFVKRYSEQNVAVKPVMTAKVVAATSN